MKLSLFSEYGFAERVVEGISLSINSIVIRISAKAFNASFELSQLQVYSVNTSWVASDLRFTRIQDPQRGEVSTPGPFHRNDGMGTSSGTGHYCNIAILWWGGLP